MTARKLDVRRRRLLRIAAQLLDYPDDGFFDRLPLLQRAAATVDSRELDDFLAHVGRQGRAELAQDYVDTFDLRRRTCLYLTYYSFGDTRKRGMALLRFAHAYRTAGFEIQDGELPDHLGVVCEFTAAEPAAGLRLFAEHRAGLELLRMALADVGSPYLAVVDAVRAALPEPAPRDLDKALALARSGPPAEEVGLEPFGPPAVIGSDELGGVRR
jgi:nitrate reductase molybdenum cofactor assembly chaperone NarJ/NarW